MKRFEKAGALAGAFLDLSATSRMARRRALRSVALAYESRTRSDTSFASEYVQLRSIIDSLAHVVPTCVDIAAGNGVTQSCTTPLYRSGWDGLAVEVDVSKFQELSFVLADCPSVRLARAKVTPDNVSTLLEACGIPKAFGFLNLDIDSFDLDVMRGMLTAGFAPQVVSMEINEKIPAKVHFEVKYSPDFEWIGGNFYGCSIAAACDVMFDAGYMLHNVAYNNAFFVASRCAPDGWESQDPSAAYEAGYLQQADRLTVFPWNQSLDYLQSLHGDELLVALGNLFSSETTPYELRLA